MMKDYRIIIADDHLLFRQGVKKIFEDIKQLEVVGEAGDGFELLTILKKTKFDMVILDISMPKLRGIEAACQIKKDWPNSKILMLSMHKNQDYIYAAINSGADGYLFKGDSDDDLHTAIDVIRKGNFFISPKLLLDYQLNWLHLIKRGNSKTKEILSNREVEVLKLVAEGYKSKEIAELLFISKRTIDAHRANIMKKLKLTTVADIAKYALHRGYTQMDI